MLNVLISFQFSKLKKNKMAPNKEEREPLLINTDETVTSPLTYEPSQYDSINEEVKGGDEKVNPPPENKKSVKPFPFLILNLMNALFSCADKFEYIDQYLYKYYAGPLEGNVTINTAR